jgi:anaerobic magnesium-protoporphyrin IX monomethyl ester cyclase
MDILLTHGYSLADDAHERAVMKPYPPLGLLYVSSHLKAAGFDVGVFDTTFRGLSELEESLARTRPPIVGIYANLMTRTSVLRLMRRAREVGSTVVVGGPDPANYLEEYLGRGADVVVIGEGELTLEELIPRLARGGDRDLGDVRGIAFVDGDGRLVCTEPRPQVASLDQQPFPDRDAIDIHAYVNAWREHHGMGSVSLITSRGCPYTCTWCSHAVFGNTHRRRSATNVADELAMIVARYAPDLVWYADDVFTINRRWVFEYAAELRQRGLRVPFETITREDRLDEEVIGALAEMGCHRLWIGAESGSQKVLDAMRRRTSAARVREMVGLLQKNGIQVGMFIMLGYEGEEPDDIAATVEHLKATRPDTFLTTVAYPIKGTPYFQTVADRVLPLKAWDVGSDRDLTVAGRHSRRFYQFATRWMVNEVAWHQRQRSPAGLARAWVNARVGQAGMVLFEREREAG